MSSLLLGVIPGLHHVVRTGSAALALPAHLGATQVATVVADGQVAAGTADEAIVAGASCQSIGPGAALHGHPAPAAVVVLEPLGPRQDIIATTADHPHPAGVRLQGVGPTISTHTHHLAVGA